MLDQTITPKTLKGEKTTGGAAEETVDLSLNGAVAAATIAVADGTTLVLTDAFFAAAAAANWRVQQSNDNGGAWFDILVGANLANDTAQMSPEAPVKVVGGAQVLIRARVTTPGGAAAVSCSLMAFTQP